MKKVSLLICMLAVSLVSSAQLAPKKQLVASPSNGKAAQSVSIARSDKASALRAVKLEAANKQLVNQAPRRAMADGVYYNRPSGSYTCGWTRTWGGWSADIFFGVPVGKNEYENACANPQDAKWTLVTSTKTYEYEGEEGTNNLVMDGYTYNASSDTYDNGFNTFYLPTITADNISFIWGEDNADGSAFAIAGRVSPFTKAPIQAAYTGWSDGGYIFGTLASAIAYDFDGDGTAENYSMDGIWQIHEAPMSPLYVEDVVILGRVGEEPNNPDAEVPATIPEGTELHLQITNVVDGWPGDEVIADLTCTAEDIEPITNSNDEVVAYNFVFSKKEVDIIGTESIVPFVLDKEYAVVFNWRVEGVNVNVAGNDFSREDEDYYSRQPSYMILTDENGETGFTTLSYNGVTCTPIFEAMFDFVEVYDVLHDNEGNEYTEQNVLTAPVAGGNMWEVEDNTINTMAYTVTALPWYDETEAENYYFDELPEWITDWAVQVDTEGEEASGFTFISFAVEPLPEGMSGRVAKIYINGRGFKSENPIIVVQGDVTPIADGKYYMRNVGAKKFWGAGNNWGTQGSLVDEYQYVTLAQLENGTVTMETMVSNGGTSYYFAGEYMDGAATPLVFNKTAEGYYTVANTNGELFGYDGSTTILARNVAEGENAYWQLMTEEDVLAEQAAILATATAEAPVNATFLIKDADFGRNRRDAADVWKWESKNADGGTNLTISGPNSNVANYCAESYHATFSLSQLLKTAPKGIYKFTAQAFYRQDGSDNDNLPYFFANDEKSTFPVKTGAENSMADAGASFANGLYAAEPIYVEVTEDGALTVGAKLENNTNLWCIWDNFQLTYYGTDADVNALQNAALMETLEKLREQATALQGQVEIDAVKTALADALASTASINASSDPAAVKAAIETLTAAVGLGEAYVKAQVALAAMKTVVDGTNVYTEEALNTYYTQWNEKYLAGTLTKDEANALQDPNTITAWHANITVDDFLMSAWDANAGDWNPYYINTWSVEGDNDGTNFHVPFFEYWTGDDASLAERTLTATMNNVPEGNYDVTVWARVRAKNGYTAPAYGITLQANDGAPVNVAAGQQVGTSQFYLDTFTAKGVVGADGVLKIKFNVAADNNISWLSFKNVKFAPGTGGIDDAEPAVPEGWEQLIANGNLAGDDVSSFFKVEPGTGLQPATITDGIGKNGGRGILVQSQDNPANPWDTQFFIRANKMLSPGTKVHMEFDYKASKEANISSQGHGEPTAYVNNDGVGTITATTEWQRLSKDFTISGNVQTIAFNLAELGEATDYVFDNIVFWAEKQAEVEWADIIVNGDMEGTEVVNFFSKEANGAILPSQIFDGMGKDGSRGIKVESAAGASQDWDTQFWIYLPATLAEGTQYKVEFDYRSDVAGSADTQAHGEPGNYIHYQMIGSPNFTTDWQHYEASGVITAQQAEAKDDQGNPTGNKFRSIAFNLSKDKANTVKFFFDNVKFFVDKAWVESGIVNVNREQRNGETIYNLRGQKVENPTKGLYIINGKKVVIK